MKNHIFMRFRIVGFTFLVCMMFCSVHSKAQEPVTLQLKWTHAFQFAGYYAAVEQGYYDEVGLDVTIKEASPDTDPVRNVLEGEAQYGVGSSGLLLDRAAGKPVVVLAVIFQHSTYEVYAAPEIYHLRDLIGKRLMLEPQSEELIAFLKIKGIPLDSISIMTHGFDAGSLMQGKTDAMSGYVSSEPYYFRLANYPYQTFNPRSAGIDFYGDNLFTSEQELAENPERVKAFRAASLRGWKYAKEHTDEIINLIFTKYSKQHTLDYLQFESDQMIPLLQPDLIEIGYMNPNRWQHIAQTYASIGLLSEDYSFEGFIYDSTEKNMDWFYRSMGIAILIILSISALALYIFRINRRLSQSIKKIKQASAVLAENEKSYFGLFNSVSDAIYIQDKKGFFIDVNVGVKKMYGYSRGEFIGKTPEFLSATDKNDLPLIFKLVNKCYTTGKPQQFEFWGKRKNGEIFPKDVICNKGKYFGKDVIITTARDISKHKNAELEIIRAKEKAEESDRLKSAFLANMSHEIRTPMNGILGFADLLKEPNLTGEQQVEYINIIQKGGVRMLNIINDIVSISKIESGQMEVNIQESNINEQIEYIYTFFNPEIEAKGMQFSFKNSLHFKEAILKTDREKVFAILTNLVKNAVKYSEKGSIEMGYNKKANFLEFYVKDTGIGIPKDRQGPIFERFIQADIADKNAYQGAGLGLSISRAYVEMLDGKIWVESEEGIGSTFYFTLPYHSEMIKENSIENEILLPVEDASINKLKILIVEDDESSEMLISIAVQKFGKEIITVKTGTEAVEACLNNPDIDLVLMDIQLPEMNGYEATRQIRKFNKDVIIIAQTAYALVGDKEKALQAGCDDYISKPIKGDELKQMIVKYLNKK
jgi:PAS domain S-box-containing protein